MKMFKMSTQVGEYKAKDGEQKKTYAELGKLFMSDDGMQVFGEIFDPLNNKTIKFNAFEIKQKENKIDSPF